MVAWVPGVAYCCVAFMGYIKYSWVRGKHTVQYPELTHVIHTEINYLPGPRAGLHPLSTRTWHTPSNCRHGWRCACVVKGHTRALKLTVKKSFSLETWTQMMPLHRRISKFILHNTSPLEGPHHCYDTSLSYINIGQPFFQNSFIWDIMLVYILSMFNKRYKYLRMWDIS